MSYVTTIVENGEVSQNIVEINDTNQHILELTAQSTSINVDVIEDAKNIVEIGIPYILPSGFSQYITGGYGIDTFYDSYINLLTISATGLQPSGDYSVVGHSHLSSDITDFNSAVSGLLPPSNFTSLTGISGIIVTNSGTDYVVSLNDPTIQLADITDLSSDARSFLLTPSSNNLQTLITNETGSGLVVFNNSPAFSGIPTAPTAPSGTNSNQIANTSFVRNEIAHLIDSAPTTLDTLNELAQALGDDPNFATTITNSLANKANLSGAVFTGSVTIPSGTGNFNNLTVNSIDVSVSGHTHVSSNITDFNSSVSGLLPSVTGAGYVDSVFNNNVYTISVTGLQPSGNYSLVGHTHSSTDITDFNSAVSGLLPVKDIVGGSGIDVSSLSGTYTIAITGIANLIGEEVDDRVSQLLVAGTGVSLTYNDPSGTLTIDNLHTEINVLSQEPQGFVNRTDSLISFDDASRTFTIQPAVSGGSYTIYAEGIKVVKSGIETVVIGSGTALNYLHFDTTPPYNVHTKTTGFNFDTDIPIAFIHWNSDINQSTFFGEERHGIRMDSVTHKWIHNTFGVQYISGLSIGGYVLLGDGSSNSHAQIDISDGVLYQEDIIVNITDDNGSNSANEFVQPLSPIAYIPVYYHSGSTGQWVRDVATAFPLKYNATRAQYNLYSGGTWTTPNVTNNRYFAMWIVATNDMNDPILSIMGQREDSSINAAENNNNWNDINLTNIPTQELRPLYRLIFVTNDTFANTPKSSLQSILDIRKSVQSVSAGVVQNDHGSLFGLADDDHPQYVHINNARTIDAIHTFSNGLISNGLISSVSGDFDNLTVNSINVSVSGHDHVVSDITDFNSGVSGLLPSISGSGYVNSTFNNNSYTISVSGLQPSGNYSVVGHTHSSTDITDFNSATSGLLPVTNIISGSNISVTQSGTVYTVAVTGSLGLTTEEVDDRVSNLLVSGNYVNLNYDDNGNTLTISVTGVQPSGNYANSVHSHTSSDITDFNSSVSGLLPVTNILGGTNISVIPSGTQFTINVSGSLGLTTEEVDDRVSNLLVAGTGISLDYNDGSNTLTIHNTSISPDEIEEYIAYTNLPASGNINILYRTTDDGRLYQWSGSVYAEIGPDSVTTGSHAFQHYTNGIDPILNVVSRPATLTATVNNYTHNNADIIYLNANANRIITGLVSATDGTVKLLINSSLFTITLDHQDTNSNPENRFMVPFGSDYVLQPGYSITIVYDSNALRWRILA
jgi:hypothetical protein